jgi:hypothetical protein
VAKKRSFLGGGFENALCCVPVSVQLFCLRAFGCLFYTLFFCGVLIVGVSLNLCSFMAVSTGSRLIK